MPAPMDSWRYPAVLVKTRTATVLDTCSAYCALAHSDRQQAKTAMNAIRTRNLKICVIAGDVARTFAPPSFSCWHREHLIGRPSQPQAPSVYFERDGQLPASSFLLPGGSAVQHRRSPSRPNSTRSRELNESWTRPDSVSPIG